MSQGSETGVACGDADEARAATGWRAAQGVRTTTLLLRHGQTEMSAERRFAGRGDAPLTPTGWQQAAAAAARLPSAGASTSW